MLEKEDLDCQATTVQKEEAGKLVQLTVRRKSQRKIVWDKQEGLRYLSAVASGGLCGKSLYLLSVQLSSSAVVLGIGSIGCAPMLIEKHHLPQYVGKETA